MSSEEYIPTTGQIFAHPVQHSEHISEHVAETE